MTEENRSKSFWTTLEIALTWQQTGMTDTVRVSANGKNISGSNPTGVKVTGNKRP